MTLGEVISQIWLPQALFIGVEYRLFWELNPKRLEPFFKCYKDKLEFENKRFKEQMNISAWLQGHYNCKAFGAVMTEGKQKYYEKPIDLDVHEESEMKTAAQRFEAYAIVFNKRKFGDCGG